MHKPGATPCWTARRQIFGQVYDTVRRAGETAIAACRPGTAWVDVHRAATLVVAEGLVELGVLRGSPQKLVENGAAKLFFPRGVGHPVGLGVRHTGARLS